MRIIFGLFKHGYEKNIKKLFTLINDLISKRLSIEMVNDLNELFSYFPFSFFNLFHSLIKKKTLSVQKNKLVYLIAN